MSLSMWDNFTLQTTGKTQILHKFLEDSEFGFSELAGILKTVDSSSLNLQLLCSKSLACKISFHDRKVIFKVQKQNSVAQISDMQQH